MFGFRHNIPHIAHSLPLIYDVWEAKVIHCYTVNWCAAAAAAVGYAINFQARRLGLKAENAIPLIFFLGVEGQ